MRLEKFNAGIKDKENLWPEWRSSLQGGNSLPAVSLIEAQSA
jgi:hypothetical protein